MTGTHALTLVSNLDTRHLRVGGMRKLTPVGAGEAPALIVSRKRQDTAEGGCAT